MSQYPDPRIGCRARNSVDSVCRPAPKFSWRRVLPLGVIVVASGIVIGTGWHRELSLEALVRHRAAIDAFIIAHRTAALGAYIGLYIVLVALSVPGALVLTLGGGILFGAVVGGLAAAFGATVGAVCIFLLAKSALGEQLACRAGPRVARATEGFCADAFSYLLFLRLVPVFPFWVVNLVAALAGVRLMTFIAATAIGILPATFAFAFVGAGLNSVIIAQEQAYRLCMTEHPGCRLHFDPTIALTPEIFAALGLLGIAALVPVLVKRIRARSRAAHPRRSNSHSNPGEPIAGGRDGGTA